MSVVDSTPPSDVRWVDAADNPWGVRVLDVRPITLTMMSTSTDPQCASNAASFAHDDGTGFIGQEPPVRRAVEARLRFPVDRYLADGVLFLPREMEHKWAIYYHRGRIVCVRSWLRQVRVVARIESHADHVEIVEVRGMFTGEDEEPQFTVRVLDYLLRSHALGTVYPAPLPVGLETDPGRAAMWCMSSFGNQVQFATPLQIARREPEAPLRTISLLHIAAAQGDASAIEASVAAGVPLDLLAPDGLAPLHWALVRDDLTCATLLLDLGSPVDVRSVEGATPLMNAVQAGSTDKVLFLLSCGADVNARDHRGFTALHRAAEMGQVGLVGLLLAYGASQTSGAQGQTPQSLAEARGADDVVALLRERGPIGERIPPAADSGRPDAEEHRPRLDRFVGRVEDMVWASCVSCERKTRGPICEAYPDGIPEVILNGKVDHKTPFPGDRDLTYLPVTPEIPHVEGE